MSGVLAILCLVLAFGLSLVTVRLCIAYALRRGMLDLPGQRRSHTQPTARGGGVGIVLGSLAGAIPALAHASLPMVVLLAFAIGTLAVAAIGWLDDHGSLAVRPRLLVQLLACALYAAALVAAGVSWLWWLPLVVAGTWSINLHNFIDGIDGLLAQQCLFVGLGLALLAQASGLAAVAVACAAFAAAAAGFWVFNRAPARIFMGDVGSGAVGFVVFALTGLLWLFATPLLWPALVLSCAVVMDATLTLVSRMARGRRWYTPHREHLYQWMIRRGMGHAQAGAWFAGWNLLVAAPLAWLAWRWPAYAPALCVAGYAAAAVVWFYGKNRYGSRRQRANAAK